MRIFSYRVLNSLVPATYILVLGSLALYRLVRKRRTRGYIQLDDDESDNQKFSPPTDVALKKTDNRLTMGAISCPLVTIQFAVHALWLASAWHASPALPVYTRLATLVQAVSWAIVTITTWQNVASFRAVTNLPLYRPAWSCFTYGFYVLSLATTLHEAYWHWFAPGRENVPFLISADVPSKLLLTTTFLSMCIFATFAVSQYGPQYEIIADPSQPAPVVSGVSFPESKLAPTPEFGRSWFSSFFFTWLIPIIRKGKNQTLSYHDLYALSPDYQADHVWARYRKHKKPGRSLTWNLFWTFLPELSFQFICSFALSFFVYGNPFFLQRILQYIHDPSVRSVRAAFLDAIAMFIVSIVNLIIISRVLWIGRRIGIRLQGVLVAELSGKTLRRRGKASDNGTASSATDDTPKDDPNQLPEPTSTIGDDKETAKDGDSEAADGKIMNLMTSDFSRVTEVAAYLDNLYECPLQLVIGVIYLYNLLGISALISCAVVVIYYFVSRWIMDYVARTEEILNATSDKRLAKILARMVIQGVCVWSNCLDGSPSLLNKSQSCVKSNWDICGKP